MRTCKPWSRNNTFVTEEEAFKDVLLPLFGVASVEGSTPLHASEFKKGKYWDNP